MRTCGKQACAFFKGDEMAEKKTTKKTTKKAEPVKEEKVTRKVIKEEPKPLEVTYIYHEGDDISKVAKALTGKDYMEFKLLSANGKTLNDLTDGDILKWSL